MSVEEDTELRDLVAQTLENKGILPKIRAELRANVFHALEENTSTKETLLKNDELSAFLQLPFGSLTLNLIREFLEYLGLDFTLSVFDPETKYGKDYSNLTRESMIRQLNLTDCKKNPILYEAISKVVSVVVDESSVNSKNVKNTEVLNHVDVNGDDSFLTPSPHNLNTTYVMSKTNELFSPVSFHQKESPKEDENNDSIDEDLISNKSSLSDTSLKDGEHFEKIKSLKNMLGSPFMTNGNEESKPDPIVRNNAPAEIDLLTFTPVKEVKTKDKVKIDSTDKKLDEEKSKPSSLSVLGDLPPLNAKTEPKVNKMNAIKAIIDQGLDLDNSEDDLSQSSKGSKRPDAEEDKQSSPIKSDRSRNTHVSEKSDKTETVDDFEEDISDLINSHTSSDNQFTVDETVSKISDVGDHLESI